MKRDFALILPNPITAEHEVMTITLFDNPTEADMATRAIYCLRNRVLHVGLESALYL